MDATIAAVAETEDSPEEVLIERPAAGGDGLAHLADGRVVFV